ncbi:MAG: ACP S-malonyltransferase [Rhodobiaceae bacterium]|nr:ACP S-malonyltransferase [Rhodobiaceae bacterium]MCC0056512.1 ACP S-malonyltransferase [Rhodobiaceae bacterium]
MASSRAFVFPGQGSQKAGMGRDLCDQYGEARAVFDEVDEALGEKLSAIIFDGPDETLTLTRNAQPALMAVSIAVLRVMEARGFDLAAEAAYVAGHSLGEYSALAAAGAFSVSDAARLLRTRGEAMQKAVPVGEGAMAALLGLDLDAARAVAAEAAAAGGVCTAANDNAPGQVVVSGDKAAVERAVVLAKDAGAMKAMLLPVSAPFHCALMAPAADVMAEALAGVAISAPKVPLVANVRASAISAPEEIRASLVEQVTGAVRWRESVLYMAQHGVTELVEIGAGKVLTGLAKRIDRALAGRAIGSPADIDAWFA